MRRSLAACLILLGGAAACDGCSGGDRPASVLLLTLDTTRADALSCYGGRPGVTPNLDRLAAEGVLYEDARTVSPLTMPAHASILTGLYPIRHTVRTNSQAALPRSARTLAEDARRAGVQTAAFVAAVVLADDFGLDQGFEHYDQPVPPAVQEDLHYEERGAAEVADAAIRWLAGRDRARPFLLWVHFFDPHLPHRADERFVRQAGGDPYLGEVAAVDHAVGRILAALGEDGALDSTLVLATADHGEALGEHGERTHGALVYDATLRVPLILRYPDGHRSGERSDEIVSVADVHPTLLEALGVPVGPNVDGRSLFRRTVPEDRGVYFESYYGFYSYGWSQLAGWVDRRGKYIHSSDPEFYAVDEDPDESNNRVGGLGDGVERYRRPIAALRGKPVLVRGAGDLAAEAMAEQLRKLGYSGAGAQGDVRLDPLAPSDRLAPQDRIEGQRAYLRAVDLQGSGRSDEAIRILKPLLVENPLHHLAWCQLSTAYVSQERWEEALEAAKRSLEIGADWYGPHLNLGISYDNLVRIDEALRQYDLVLAFKPRHEQVLGRVVEVLERLGRDAEAARYRRLLREARGSGR